MYFLGLLPINDFLLLQIYEKTIFAYINLNCKITFIQTTKLFITSITSENTNSVKCSPRSLKLSMHSVTSHFATKLRCEQTKSD